MYTIGEAALKTNLTISTIRYYDKQGLLPFLNRHESGHRLFTLEDLEHLQLIKHLKETKMPLNEIKQFFDWFIEGDTTLEQRRDLFYERQQAVTQQLESLQEALTTINYKCWIYDAAVAAGTLEVPKQLKAQELPAEIRHLHANK